MFHVFFSHGKESGPKATKIQAMQQVCNELGISCSSLDYRGMEAVAPRVERLRNAMDSVSDDIVLVGSSMGAYVSLKAMQGKTNVVGLYLMAPAVGLPGYEVDDMALGRCQTEIIHGWLDDIVPPSKVIEFAQTHQLSLHLVKDEHRLASSVELIKVEFSLFLRKFIKST